MSHENKLVKRLLYSIPILILFIALCIFPFGLIRIEKQSTALEKGMAVSGTITENSPIAGVFMPSYSSLSSIGFRFYLPNRSDNPGHIRLTIKDEQETVIYDTTVNIKDMKNNEYYDFPLSLTLDITKPYVYQLHAYDYAENAPCIYLGSPDIASSEQHSVYHNGIQLPNNAAVMRYTYQARASFSEALPFYILLCALALLTVPLWGRPYRRFWFGVCMILCMVFMILASDESRSPLVLTGDTLRRDAGSIDGTTLVIHPDTGYSGKLAYTWNYMLEEGSYRIGVEYRTDMTDPILLVQSNGRTVLSHSLNPDYTYEEIPLILEQDSQEVLFEIYYSGTATLSLHSLQLASDGRFYQDAAFGALLLLLSSILAFFISKSRWFIQLPISSKAIGCGLLLISATASLPLLNGYLNWADDLCYHLIRIEGIKDGLLDGQLPVIIYPEGLYGNGYLNCMYPNLFLYFPALLRIIGVSMAGSYKCLLILFHGLTAFLTYFSVKSMLSHQHDTGVQMPQSTSLPAPMSFSIAQKAGLLAALLYTLCPYRFTNAYARGALGELLAMTFMPLLLAGLYHVLLGERKNWWMLVLGLSGLVQTHVLSAVIGLILCLVCGIVCLLNILREKRLLVIGIAALTTVLINLWFIVPFLYFYTSDTLWPSALDWCSFGEYSLHLSGLAGTMNTSGYRTLALGLPIVFCGIFALFTVCFEKKRDRLAKYCICLLTLGLISTFMVINQFPSWPLMRIGFMDFLLKNIQFAWRMLGPASILLIMSGCIFLYRSVFVTAYRKGIVIALAAVAFLSCTPCQPEDFAYKNYYDTTTIGHESKLRGIPRGDNTIIYPYEWRPYGTMEADLSTTPVFTEDSVVLLQNFHKNGTTVSLTYICAAPDQSVSLPLVHYAGYQGYDENGKSIVLQTNADNNTIQIPLIGDSQEHQIIVEYKGLLRFRIAFWISVLAFAGWILLLLKQKNSVQK